MKFKEAILLYREDLHRTGYSRFRFLYDPLVSLLLFFRLSDCNNCFLRTPSKFMLKLLSYKTGVQLVCGTEMGGGIRIVHHGTIVVTKGAKIGKNLTLHQGVTIGKSFGGKKYGYPTIGDNVVIYPNSVIVGNISIGQNVVIGAGSIVISDIPDNSVVAGNPAKVISNNVERAINDNEWELYYHLPKYSI